MGIINFCSILQQLLNRVLMAAYVVREINVSILLLQFRNETDLRVTK
jgi:hypothetical protein